MPRRNGGYCRWLNAFVNLAAAAAGCGGGGCAGGGDDG